MENKKILGSVSMDLPRVTSVTVRVARHWNRLARELWMLHP